MIRRCLKQCHSYYIVSQPWLLWVRIPIMAILENEIEFTVHPPFGKTYQSTFKLIFFKIKLQFKAKTIDSFLRRCHETDSSQRV